MSDRTQSWRQMAAYVLITVALVAGGWSVASSAAKTATFGFKCASTTVVLPPTVKQVVSGLLAKGGDERVTTYGDRAVALRLRRGSEITYFVPLSCNGRGSC